jgi:hypothetical protein
MAVSLGVDSDGEILGTPLPELIAIDIIVIIGIVIFESVLKNQTSKIVQYDRIELIKPENRAKLIADLEERLGLSVTDVKVGAVDFLRDMAVLRVYYEGEDDKDINNKIKIKESEYANV